MLDNRLVEPYFPPAYYLAMANLDFRSRVLKKMKGAGLTKAELSRRSKVPYHALDKFLKRDGATTSTENAIAIANTLGIRVDSDREYEELREIFYGLSEEDQKALVRIAKGLRG